jgi:hypothetical protein
MIKGFICLDLNAAPGFCYLLERLAHFILFLPPSNFWWMMRAELGLKIYGAVLAKVASTVRLLQYLFLSSLGSHWIYLFLLLVFLIK